MNTIQQTLCAALLALTCGSAMAEKWEWVHRNFRSDYYVDVDSIKRDGEIATARVLQNTVCESPINGDYKKTVSTSIITSKFNCADGSRKILSGIWKNKKGEIVSEDSQLQLNFLAIINGGVAAWASKACQKEFTSPRDDLRKSHLMPFSSNCVAVGGTSEGVGEQRRAMSDLYLDLTRLSVNNGFVLAWTRRIFENPPIWAEKNLTFYTRDDKIQINCTTREYAVLEIYYFDKENKQIDFGKHPSNTALNYQSARSTNTPDNLLEQACKNAVKSQPSSEPVPQKPNKPNSEFTISSTGTAFGVSKNQFISNAHVVEGCKAVKVGGVTSIVKAIDTKSDLALLNVLNSGNIAKLRAGRLRQGDAVTVVGYPLNGILATGAQVTAGNVSALAGMGNDSRFIQISAPVQPGNSGGPLVDSSGNVVGVVVSKLNALKMASITGDIPQNVNFAISPLVLQAFLEANSVDYLTAPSTKNLSTADVADVAKKYTSLVECYK
jgi:V8-like Glu-specific endopeptidase